MTLICKDPRPGYCIVEVPDRWTRWPSYHQCARKAVVDGKWCRQHDPEAVKKREAEVLARQQEAWLVERRRISGPRLYEVLRRIAEGHNDPRSLAIEAIKGLDK